MASPALRAARNTVVPEERAHEKSASVSPVCGQEGSVKQQHCQLVKLTGLTIIPGLVLICRCIIDLVADTEALVSNNYIMDQIEIATRIGDLVHYCQEERGTTALFVSSEGDPLVKNILAERYQSTDQSISSLSKWIPIYDPTHFQSRVLYHNAIKTFRANLSPKNTTLVDVIRFYSDNNAVFINLIGDNLNPERSVPYWKDLVAYKLLILSKEHAGVERALGSTLYARGRFPSDELLWYRDKLTMGEQFLRQSMSYSSYTKQLIDLYYVGSQLESNLEMMRQDICVNNASLPSIDKGTIWFDNMTDYIDILKNVHDALAKRISQIASKENMMLNTSLWGSAIQLLMAAMIVPVVTILNRKIVEKIQTYGSDLSVKTLELEQERERTEMLLLQLLPRSVARKLIHKGQVMPEAFKSVTIMFSDVSGFSDITGRCSPSEAIQILNDIYWLMDDLVDNYDVYRVDITGAGYMVASGVPKRNGTKHVEEIARLSLDILTALSKNDLPNFQGEEIKMRIGFHTGPCAAGVVGNIMPRYCVFGDTVNIASRMETTGLPQRIQMTERCANVLSAFNIFRIVEREMPYIKVKEEMRTFWLEGFEGISDV